MNRIYLHIAIILLLGSLAVEGFAQKVRYVQRGSLHALSVPENDSYNFEWSIVNNDGTTLNAGTDTHITNTLYWGKSTPYSILVRPVSKADNCYGEAVTMTLIPVEYMSLHVFDDIYFTTPGLRVEGDMSENDFDEQGANIYYNPTPVVAPKYGNVDILANGEFIYTPNIGFIGVDSFMYEAYNDLASPMFANAYVKIVVKENVRVADLYIEKTGPEKELLGKPINYLIKIKNNGPDAAQNVVVKDLMPFGVFTPTFITTNGGKPQDWNGYYKLSTLAKGDSVLLYITGNISNNSPEWLFNQALVYSDTFDPRNIDNDSIWPTHVSRVYANLPGKLFVPSCKTTIIPGEGAGNNMPLTYEWLNDIGLNNKTLANPVFTPDDRTIGKTSSYVLKVTDSKGYVAYDTISITVPDLPVAVIDHDILFINKEEELVVGATQSVGQELSYLWWATEQGHITSLQNTDSISFNDKGKYFLRITDYLGCTSDDSLNVMYESHPPIIGPDTISLIAGTDSLINVLANDRDRNGFNLKISGLLTPPANSELIEINENGDIRVKPDSRYWKKDSLQYTVCNDGFPERCTTAWLIIDSKRPPLNADVVINKTGPQYAFWNDTIRYEITLRSNGPDTATVVTIFEKFDSDFFNPKYSPDNGITWFDWPANNLYTFRDSLRPNEDEFKLLLRANIRPKIADNKTIKNVTYISKTDIIENNFVSDTSVFYTRIKTKVVANAGKDITIGSCLTSVSLDGTKSTGDSLIYIWTPSDLLLGATTATPTFLNNGKTQTFKLDIFDNNNLSSTDYVTVTVLPAPVANAGPDRFLETGQSTVLDGRTSTGYRISYSWTTNNGRFVGETDGSIVASDSIGHYTLTVTDSLGCRSVDEVDIWQFYFLPFAIPDYYSMYSTDAQFSGNVLDNDYEPNNMFSLYINTATQTTINTKDGGVVVIKRNGDFTYTPRAGYTGVDEFEYDVCNTAIPPRCSKGYVKITRQNSLFGLTNLFIDKKAKDQTALKNSEVEFIIDIENKGTEAVNNVVLTDRMSEYITNPKYLNNGFWENWTGTTNLGTLQPGQKLSVNLKGTVLPTSPSLIFNAAMVSSGIYDEIFDWNDVDNRNVDTVSVRIVTDLLARVNFVELRDKDLASRDFKIGACDNLSYLTAETSLGKNITGYQWSPAQYVASPNSVTTTITKLAAGKTTDFSLLIFDELTLSSSSTRIKITVAPEVIADAGPDRKINDGETLTINASNSEPGPDVAKYEWFRGTGSAPIDFTDPEYPVVAGTGAYFLSITDDHLCLDTDTTVVRVNELYAVSDIIVVLANGTITAKVSTNDFDPNKDNIVYTGEVSTGPFNGVLSDFPPNLSANGANAINAPNKISSNGTFTYTPNRGYVGFDFFKYQICDTNDPPLCIEGLVYIKVIEVDPVNSPPVANHDHFFVNPGGLDTLKSNVLTNDYDFDGGKIKMAGSLAVNPTKGAVIFTDSLGNFRYVPFPDSRGTDRFVYTVCDNGKGGNNCDTASVTIEIYKLQGENHRPVAVDDAYFVVEKPISGNVLLNDYDPNNDELVLNLLPVRDPAHGTIRFYENGNFDYFPSSSFEGTDIIEYEIFEKFTKDQHRTSATLYITCINEKRYTTDLEIKKVGPATIMSGTTITYTLKATVKGPTLANDVVISDIMHQSLTKKEFSLDNGNTWTPWGDYLTIDRMMLYDDTTFMVRGIIPKIFSGNIINTAQVTHDMNEKNKDNNQSVVTTNVLQRVIADAGPDTIIGSCISAYVLSADSSVGLGDLVYKWSPAELLDKPNTANPVFKTAPGDSIVFTLVVSSTRDGLSHTDTATVSVQVAQKPVARAGENVWPEEFAPVELNGNKSSNTDPYVPLKYLWWYYDNQKNVVVVDSTEKVVVNRSNEYFLTVTDKYGCTHTDDVYVTYPIDEFVAIDDYVQTYQQLNVNIFPLRNDIIDSDDEYNMTQFIIIEYPKHGQLIQFLGDSFLTYVPDIYYFGPDTFTYSVSTLYANAATANVYIDVMKREPIIPEGFSPNGDGINDTWIIGNIELYESNTVTILNRWGNIIYQKQNYSNDDAWNGIANKGIRIGSGPVPAGSYLYIIDLGPDKRIRFKPYTGTIYVASDK